MTKIVLYSIVLNQHQAPVADALWEMTGHSFVFVELVHKADMKGATEDYSKRPYLLRCWESPEKYAEAMELARTAECCIIAGAPALPFMKERMKLNLLTFDMSERWLKHGWKSLGSPRLLKWLAAYWLGGWRRKRLYKLCCSAFCAQDHYALGTFKNKCYKWGYFTKVETSGSENVDLEIMMQHQPSSDCSARADVLQSPRDICFSDDGRKTNIEAFTDVSTSEITPLMWCSRFLMLKHPELPILLAERLKLRGYRFHLDMYGSGEYEEASKKLAESLELMDVVTFHGAVPNDQVHEAMRKAEIFLFTSDRYEGWGAVANESLSEGCVLVASDAIGSSPYLIDEGVNGFMFHSSKASCSFGNPDNSALDSLCKKVEWSLEHPAEKKQMQQNAVMLMQKLWSPENAVKSLLQLIDNLNQCKDTPFVEGPCSKA